MRADCNANRLYTLVAGLNLDDVNPDKAWQELIDADKEKDVADIRSVSAAGNISYEGLCANEYVRASSSTPRAARVRRLSSSSKCSATAR